MPSKFTAEGAELVEGGGGAGPGSDSTAIHDDTPAEISAITEKVVPVAADLVVIEDSAAANVKKRAQIGNFPAAAPAADSITNVHLANMVQNTIKLRNTAGTDDPEDVAISSLSEEVSPGAGDWLLGEESGGALRKIDVGNLPGGAGLPVVDTTSIVEGSGDNTKELRFEVDGQTTGVIGVLATTFTTAKTITFPDATDQVVCRDTTDVLTNKTLTTPTIGDLSNAGHDHADAAGGGTLGNGVVSNAIIRDSAAYSALGRTSGLAGDIADIVAGADEVFRRSGSGNLEFGTLVTNNIGASQVTNAKLANMAQNTLKLRNAAGAGDPEDVAISGLTEEASPSTGDFLLAEESGGNLRKVNVGNLPGGSAPPFADTNSIVEGSADNTKELRFEVDGQTTSVIGVFATTFTTAKTITFPDATDQVVCRDTTDVLTNKTLTQPTIGPGAERWPAPPRLRHFTTT
jgi:hypothetical protein